LISLPGWRRGSTIRNPRPVADADYQPGFFESLARALKLREYPPLRLDAWEETALTTCINLSRRINHSVNGVAKFDAPEVRSQLLTWQQKMSRPFYAEFLLATWHERQGDAAKARRWKERALEHAPVVLVRRYEFMDGTPLAHTSVGTLGVECRMKTATSSNTAHTLKYIDLVTDKKGQVYLPCYDTRIRCNSVQYPKGYEIETGWHGYLEANARYNRLPTIYVWKKGRPRPPTDLPPSEFYDYRDACQADGLTHRIGHTEFRIARCFRLRQDGTVSATDGRGPAGLPGEEAAPSFEAAHACLDQAVVRFERNTRSGHAILQVRLFDHRSRALLTKYHAPAAWSYNGRDAIYVKSFARRLPDNLDVWFWVARFNPQEQTKEVPPDIGAEAEFVDYKAVLTHVHGGTRPYSARGGAITFSQPATEEDSSLQVAFRITATRARREGESARVIAVSQDGSRLMGDRVIYPSNSTFVCDFPIHLSELDHFELHPIGQEVCFFFDSVRLPDADDRELAESWQVEIPTNGQTGSFATSQTDPAELKVTILRGRNSMSFGTRQRSGDPVGHAYWAYGSEGRDVDTHSTIVSEKTGLSARMLSIEIVPLGADHTPVGTSRGFGQSGGVFFRAFNVPTQRIHAVRIVVSWSANQRITGLSTPVASKTVSDLTTKDPVW
jgi:hypothetical protein